MKISIITATYECVATVGDCLASVASQTHADREHLVIDGASADGTLAVLETHRPQLAVLVSEPDRGLYDALNKGLARADTRYQIAADYDLMLRVLRQLPGRAVYLPQVLVRMRLGGESNRTLAKIARKSWEDFLALRRNGLGGPAGLGAVGALAWKNLSKVPQFVARDRRRD